MTTAHYITKIENLRGSLSPYTDLHGVLCDFENLINYLEMLFDEERESNFGILSPQLEDVETVLWDVLDLDGAP